MFSWSLLIVATSYRVLPSVAVWCSMVQCGAVQCSAVQSVAVHCTAKQCVAVCLHALPRGAVCCTVLPCFAGCCSVVQRCTHGAHSDSSSHLAIYSYALITP